MYVFVYGTLKSGYNAGSFNLKNHQEAVTLDEFVVGDGGFPRAVHVSDDRLDDEHLKNKGRLSGHLFVIGPNTLVNLDRYEGYPSFYDRRVVKVKTDKGVVEAMMYEAQSAFDPNRPLLEPVDGILTWGRG